MRKKLEKIITGSILLGRHEINQVHNICPSPLHLSTPLPTRTLPTTSPHLPSRQFPPPTFVLPIFGKVRHLPPPA